MPLIIIRSVLFHGLFYCNCIFWFVASILAWPFPSSVMMRFARGWAMTSLYLHEVITGAKVIVRGVERIPPGPVLVAAKHQSAWETMALLLYFPKATYIFKRELLFVPLFGLHMLKAEQVPINRGNRVQSLAAIQAGTRKAIERGRQIIIFPEGTRRSVGAPPAYKFGVSRIYDALDVPCVPVALTSGLAWPRNTLLHYPKPILVEFLEPLPGTLSQTEFFKVVQQRIEDGTNRLLAEAGYTADLSQDKA